jgi:hypothetical protein
MVSIQNRDCDDISYTEHFGRMAHIIQKLLKKSEKKLARSFNFMFRYIHVVDVLSLNNSKFGDYVDRIYLRELEIKDIPETDRFALFNEERAGM